MEARNNFVADRENIMHIVIMTRGIYRDVREFIHSLRNQFLPFKTTDPEMVKHGVNALQIRVCPIELYDVSFPKEHRDVMLNTLFRGHDKGKPINKFVKKWAKWLGRIMHLKPIPEEWDTTKRLAVFPTENIEVIGIGMKDDKYIEGKHEGI